MPRPPARFVLLAGASLLGSVLLGVGLRWFLAGVPLPAGEYPAIRHAHSHLGYYGVLFPLAWAALATLGVPVPGPRTTALYAAAVLAGSAGFAIAGYGPLAIAGSSLVLGVWLHWAWRLRQRAVARRDWAASAPWSVLAAAAAIPAVAVFTDREPALAQELAQGFLTVLLFGVVVPAALALDRAPRPPAPLWTLATLGAGLALGPLPVLPAQLCLAVLGVLVAVAGWRARAALEVRLLWVGLGAALLGLGTGLLPDQHAVAIAGLHYAFLGPLLLTLGRLLLGGVPRWARLAYVTLIGAFTISVIAQAWWMPPAVPLAAAWLGSATALAWTIALALAARRG